MNVNHQPLVALIRILFGLNHQFYLKKIKEEDD
jgi:hypothetical protein